MATSTSLHSKGATTARSVWRETVAEVAERATQMLPECHGRIEAAVKMILAGDVELLPEGKAKVASQSNGTTEYIVCNGTCECKDFPKAPNGWCKHRISAGILKRVEERLQSTVSSPRDDHADPLSDAPVESPHGIDPRFITYLHGKPFIRYAGLLAMAHERGLVSLEATFISVTDQLALATATAVFSDGRRFTECADATPTNVPPHIRPHFPRMALTRCKARVLRDALNIGMVAMEELGEGE